MTSYGLDEYDILVLLATLRKECETAAGWDPGNRKPMWDEIEERIKELLRKAIGSVTNV